MRGILSDCLHGYQYDGNYDADCNLQTKLRPTGEAEIAAGPRIGITKAAEKPWRYGLKGSAFLSKPFGPIGGA